MKTLMFFYALLCLVACKHTSVAEEKGLLDSCESNRLTADCSYYECVESRYRCGPKGYPMGYGKRYCERFGGFCGGVLRTEAAQRWVAGTKRCLQRKIFDNQSTLRTCDELMSFGFASHSYCYTGGSVDEGGASFCALDPIDWALIANCVNYTDQVSLRAALQIAATATRCGKFFLGGLAGFLLNDETDDRETPDSDTVKKMKGMSESQRKRRAQEFFDLAKSVKAKAGQKN